ncbi:MAG: hypothetical protein LW809_00465 [Vampirovibrionales bacterium]|jgi:hypothetical protein|nr:hypothetical protein [Vampirovibrionales bacterium]
MKHPSRFQHFFDELPLGESQLSNAKGEFITVIKDASTVTLSKDDFIQHTPQATAKRLNFSFTSSVELAGAYALSDCWEEAEEEHHYPVSHTNQFIAECLIAEVMQQTPAILI